MPWWRPSRHKEGELRFASEITRPPPVKIRVDDALGTACEGESVAAALLAAGILHLRSSPRQGEPRGMFCAMGVCQECLVEVDGRAVPACMTPVREGMSIRLRR